MGYAPVRLRFRCCDKYDFAALAGEVSYYDVGERRLARAGATLSRRIDNGKGVWRLELSPENGSQADVEQPGGPGAPPSRVARVLPAILRGIEPEVVLRVGREDSANGTSALSLIAPELAPAKDAIGRLRAMLERQYDEIMRHDVGIRLDHEAEHVHQLRVAARRARAVLRAARPVLDKQWSEPLRAELKWLGGTLGPRRDLDVLIAHLREEVGQLEQPERKAARTLLDVLGVEREAAQAVALEALSSERYFALLDSLEDAARGPKVRRGEVALRELAAREFRRLRKAADGLAPDSTDDELHRARILGKRARYAAELATPELGKESKRVVARAKALQDVLGMHQDAIVAEARLRGLLSSSGSGAAFAAGRLVERERQRRREARKSLPEAWRELDRSARAAFG